MVELDLEDCFLDYFGSLVYDRLRKAGVAEDRWPKLVSVISHVRECLDEEKFSQWVNGLIDLESTEKIANLKPLTLLKENNPEHNHENHEQDDC